MDATEGRIADMWVLVTLGYPKKRQKDFEAFIKFYLWTSSGFNTADSADSLASQLVYILRGANCMEPLVVNYGVELGIYSSKSQGFLRHDLERRTVRADSIHPFLKVQGPHAVQRDQRRRRLS